MSDCQETTKSESHLTLFFDRVLTDFHRSSFKGKYHFDGKEGKNISVKSVSDFWHKEKKCIFHIKDHSDNT